MWLHYTDDVADNRALLAAGCCDLQRHVGRAGWRSHLVFVLDMTLTGEHGLDCKGPADGDLITRASRLQSANNAERISIIVGGICYSICILRKVEGN